MHSQEIREVFLKYFEEKGYLRHASSSLVPAGDQTLLFTNAGMVQFKDYFLGLEKPESFKMTTSQKCVRAGGKHNDLDQVGLTARHHTFFEMLGNFIFKGADKLVAIQEAWELITKRYNIPKEKLWVTVFHEDDESRRIWIDDIGVPEDRVIDCGEEDNFWSMGDIGPCGPCTEIFYDHGEDVAGGPPGSPEAEGDRYTEIWNLVFMQYEMHADGTRVELESLGLDTGMGLERLSAVLQNVHNNFDSDVFSGIINKIQTFGDLDITSARVIADHIRSSVFLISDQVYPSNEGRGYVLRRIIRRAMGFAYRCGVTTPFFHKLTTAVSEVMGEAYPEIKDHSDVITQVIKDEELRFHATIESGMKILQGFIDDKKDIDGKTAFMMYDTYGFPIDIASDIANKYGLKLDEEGFAVHMQEQKERSRESQNFAASQHQTMQLPQVTEFTGHNYQNGDASILHIIHENAEAKTVSEGMEAMIVTDVTPFYPEGGGQVGDRGEISIGDAVFTVTDTQKAQKAILHIGKITKGNLSVGDSVSMAVDSRRQETACNHSATHLLHAALREVLGVHVVQKGSLVNHERLRFDFTHNQPMTESQMLVVETLVNNQIRRNDKQICEWVNLADARKMNIMALFDEKYEDPVRVVRFGEFSAELCGGTHVSATGDIGMFKLVSETGIASGVRRVEAITGVKAIEWMQNELQEKQAIAAMLKCDAHMLSTKIEQLIGDNKQMRKQQEALEKQQYQSQVANWVESAYSMDSGEPLIIQSFDNISPKLLRNVLDMIKSATPKALIVLQSHQADQYMTLIGAHNVGFEANTLLKGLADTHGGRGGGNKVAAQGVLNKQITLEDISK